MKPPFAAIIAGVRYMLHPEVLGTVQEDIKPSALLPVTLLATEEIQSPHLEGLLKGFEKYDDVYSEAFAFTLVEKPGSSNKSISSSSSKVSLTGKQTFAVLAARSGDTGVGSQASPFANLPSGPYILHGKELHQAYRIYEDNLDAFSAGIIPHKHDNSDIFINYEQTLTNGAHMPIAVPSRLYFHAPSIRKPLSGIRLSVPEDFTVSGISTTLSSSNWTSLYPGPASKHSDYVRFLLDQGAVLIGKTKDGQFAAGSDWTDTEAPVNPRGDGKQLPGGSAAGADSALSGYTWLDGTTSQGALDGTLSQAAAYGVFALRTTAGVVSQTGIQTSSPKFSSVGISSRSLEDLVYLSATSIKLPGKATSQPRHIIYPTDFKSLLSIKQQSLMEEFIIAAEKELKVRAERISLADVWTRNPPQEAEKQSLDEFLGNSAYDAFCSDFYHNYGEFRSAFKAKFGEDPYTERTVKDEWNSGSKIGRDAAIKLDVFATWFTKQVAPVAANSTDKTVVLVPVVGSNKSNGSLSQIQGLRPEILSPILGTPQISAPFAQIPISGNSKDGSYMPFSAAIMGARGDDIMLPDLMKRIFDIVNWRTHVEAGQLTYPVGNNSRSVNDRGTGGFSSRSLASDIKLGSNEL